MFSVLVAYAKDTWETDQVIRFDLDRFLEGHEGAEAKAISKNDPNTLKLLESMPALLMYEDGSESANVDVVRLGRLRNIAVVGNKITFKFSEEGRFHRAVIREFADRIGMHSFEFNRTHWAVKDGGLPKAMLANVKSSYDVVLSFAGENRAYVERVARFLRDRGVRVFYDEFEAADLWGKNLVEHFELVYGGDTSQYCVMFVSEAYAEKMWTRHERRAALVRALKERQEYVLPVRFDATKLPGLSPAVGYVAADDKTPEQLGELVMRKLGRSAN